MITNASYFAFTATPKPRTIEMFGMRKEDGSMGEFDLYSMKQAIEEGFILDVLKNYTTYESYYKIFKTIEENPEFDSRKAKKKLRKFVEGQEFPLREKANEMVRHFVETSSKKIGGKAKAMVVTDSIVRAIDYYYAISDILRDLGGNFEAIVAFSGTKEYKGKELTESLINGFSDKDTPKEFKKDSEMKERNHYSFSASTSFGKSYIFEAFTKYLIEEHNGVDNIAFIVPTKALINQVSFKIKRLISDTSYKLKLRTLKTL